MKYSETSSKKKVAENDCSLTKMYSFLCGNVIIILCVWKHKTQFKYMT